jgi:hypothetical protein
MGDSVHRPASQGTPWEAGRHQNWGIFKRHFWGELIRRSHLAPQLLAQNNLLGGVHPVKLEEMFRRVHPNSGNLFHGRSLLSEIRNDLILAQTMPLGVDLPAGPRPSGLAFGTHIRSAEGGCVHREPQKRRSSPMPGQQREHDGGLAIGDVAVDR